ncbi:hypothetical protein ACNOYE_14175 [Nannocystaceae bacterium ST9]
MNEATNEAALLDDLDDLLAWSVYADWLQARGDPLGERLALELALARAERPDPALAQALERFDLDQREATLGRPLARRIEQSDFARVARLEWRFGFIVAAAIGVPSDDPSWPSPALEPVLAAILSSPAARLLRELDLGVFDREVPANLGEAIEVLEDAGPLPSLRRLRIGDFRYPEEYEISWVEVGEVATALHVAPELRELHVRGGKIEFFLPVEHAKLERLWIETGGLSADAAWSISQARLPALRRLRLWFGRPPYGGDTTIDQIEPLLTGEGLPALEQLGLENAEFSDELALALIESPLLARVRELSLARGNLGDRGGRAIVEHAAKFEHLRALDLDHNYLSPELAAELAAVLPGIVKIGRRLEPYVLEHGELGYFAQVGE